MSPRTDDAIARAARPEAVALCDRQTSRTRDLRLDLRPCQRSIYRQVPAGRRVA
jgi:hypothetical protein